MRWAVLILLSTASVTRAQTFNWNNLSGGTFSTASNWTPAGPPGPAHDAQFNVNSSFSVNFTTNPTNNTLSVSTGNVSFFLNGFTYTTTAPNNSSVLGPSTSWNVFGGTVNLGSFNIGTSPSSDSTVRFASDVTASTANNFIIGGNGQGELLLNSGADLTSANVLIGSGFGTGTGRGTATADGSGTTWSVSGNLRVGEYGLGQLVVKNAATFNCASLDIGAFPGAVGSITVSGNNATFTAAGVANIGGFLAASPGEAAGLTVSTGGLVNFNNTLNLRSVATLNINGGTLNLQSVAFQPGAAVDWTSGKVQFANGSAVTSNVLNLFLNNSSTLGTNRTLAIPTGSFTLSSPLVIGGTLSVEEAAINNPVVVQALGRMTVTGIITLGAGQTLQVDNLGTLHSDTAIFNNGGTITLGGPAAIVTGFTANNFGTVQGSGRFAGGLNNGIGGFIRALAGHHLIIDQTGNTNPGNIELAGGTLEYTKTLSNLAGGFISGRGEFCGGTSTPGSNGLSNIGTVAFSAGFTDIRGDVINASAGKIVTAGGGVTTFYDDVTHNGSEIRTQMGGRSVFFGNQSGAGPFTGTGIVEYSGDLRPGNSPSLVTYEGTVILNSSAKFEVEMRGVAPGSGYDRIQVSGAVYVAGTLDVKFLNGFTPTTGNAFTIVDNTSPFAIDGTFNGLNEGSTFSIESTIFQITYAGGTGNDVVLLTVPVPEPTALLVLVFLVGRIKEALQHRSDARTRSL